LDEVKESGEQDNREKERQVQGALPRLGINPLHIRRNFNVFSFAIGPRFFRGATRGPSRGSVRGCGRFSSFDFTSTFDDLVGHFRREKLDVEIVGVRAFEALHTLEEMTESFARG
jgi:hypothetical protein